MEKTKEEQSAGQPNLADPNANQILGEQSIEERIVELNNSLRSVSGIFNSHRKSLKARLNLWVVLSGSVAFIIFLYYIYLFKFKFPDDWSWQFGYTTIIKLTAMTALFSFLAFCLKMVKSYLYMYEHNLHKRAIINSMASFVGSAIGKENRDIIYSKLINIVVEMGNTGLISKESDFKQNGITTEMLETVMSKMKD